MSVLRWIKQRRKTTASVAVVSAAAITLGVLAFTYEGFTQTDVDLHDGGVWVTRTSDAQVGHLNVQAQELDGGFFVPSGSTTFDVLQDGDAVFLRDGDGALIDIDPASMILGATVPLHPDAQVQQRGGTVAILSPEGELWAMPVEEVSAFDAEELEPIAEVGEDAALAVGLDGTIAVAAPDDGAVHVWEVDDDGGFRAPEREVREGLADADDVSVTMVGAEAVALAGERLLLPGRSVDVPEGAVLQQVGDEASSVLLATSELLLRQPLGTGELVQQSLGSGDGPVVAPVQLGGCLYAAFPSSGEFVRTCDDASRSEEQAIEGLSEEATFRVNRGLVVLNQFETGQSWLVTDEVVLVDNWEDLLPPPSDEESEEQDESLEDSLQQTIPPPSQENHDPVATDDELGARPGRASILPVLANDSDQDGDVLTARVVSDLPSGVTVAPIANDSQLQISIPQSFTDRVISFQYEVIDGKGGSATATVTVTVRTPEENGAPEPLFEQSFTIEQTARFEYPGLQGWYDPDGDDFYLASATSPSGDQIEASPAGRILYTATGAPGQTSVELEIVDSRGESATGSIGVTVLERNTAQIQPNADFISATVGQEVSLEPLANDYVPGTQDARLSQVSLEAVPQLQGTWDAATGLVTLSSETVGVYYVPYLASAGASSQPGQIRVDIREADDEARPVAVRDIALLPQLGETLVDLIANDVDPSGGVLVVQSVRVDGVPISAQLLERRVLRLSDTQGLTSETTISYTVSNGRYTETGQVVIIPVPPPDQPAQPTAVADTATVREGDFVSVPVLQNDFSPDNLELTVSPQLVETSFATGDDGCDVVGDDAEGCAFVDGDMVRVFVPVGGPSSVRLVYEITDEFGGVATSTIDVAVTQRGEDNDPPIAQTVTARVVEGNAVSIPIPLDGIDPDGDGVTLVGYDTAPDAGRISEVGDGFFVYEAHEGSAGSTTFTYRVRDRWGAEATAAVVVGIAPPPELNQAPYAERDEVTVRPGREIAVPVLANDFDPDGDRLVLELDGISEASEELGEITIDEDRSTVDFVSPESEGEYQLRYRVGDGRGAATTGIVLVTVSEEAAPQPPVAVDDVVPAVEVVAGEPIAVPVLENDLDPDGSPDALEVEVLQGEGTVTAANEVRVTPSEETFQVVTYRVTDPDGERAQAFVFVPVASDPVPRLRDPDMVYEVRSGIAEEFDLTELVEVSQNSPRITSGDTVSATNWNGDPLVVDVDTLSYTSIAGYTGPATLSFEVTDGTDASSADANTATLSIALLVRPSSVVPPTMSGTALQVPQGGEVEFDLTSATRDPDPGDIDGMDYELAGGSSDQVDASVDGQTLRLAAPVNANVGSNVSYTIEATDPHGNAAQATFVATVVISTEPLAILRGDTAEATQGIATNVAALANDYNPFEGQAPLTIVETAVVGGDATASTDGSTVTVTPGGDFSGVLTVRYTVQDATETVQRQQTGQIVLNVKGRPEAPIRPNVLSVGDQTVTLSWAAPAANGAPISGYTVQSADGSFTQPCASTTCTLQGLVNDQTYQFTVVATNEVGDSDPSPASADARPDVRPDPPAAPRAERGDQQLTVTWAAPANRGSAITSYLLEISPPPANGQPTIMLEGNATTHVWQGLTNGTSYTFRVQAYNEAPEPSDFSPPSAAEFPAGPPFQVTGVSATRDTSIPDYPQVTVTWAPHQTQSNGADIQRYLVQPLSNGSPSGPPQEVPGAGATSATFGDGALPAGTGATLTFTVSAVNSEGTSPASAASNGVRDATTPGQPAITAVALGDGYADITVQAGSTNGARPEEVAYQVFVNGQQRGTVSATGGRVQIANQNEPGASVTVRAVSTVQGVNYPGPQSQPANAAPYGPIGNPTANATQGVNQVNVSWRAPAPNGRPVSVQININGGGWENVANEGSRSVPTNPGQETRIQVRATTGKPEGVHGVQTTQASAAANARGNPSITLQAGGVQATIPSGPEAGRRCVGTGPSGQCYRYQLAWENLTPGDYQFACYHSNTSDGRPQFQSGTVNIGAQNGATEYRVGGSTLCFSGFSGTAWMTLSGGPDNVSLRTQDRGWPPG